MKIRPLAYIVSHARVVRYLASLTTVDSPVQSKFKWTRRTMFCREGDRESSCTARGEPQINSLLPSVH